MPITLLTDLAETKLTTAAGSGTHVAITHIALGDAGGVAYDPAADATALQNERARRAIDSTAFQGGNAWIVKAEFPTDTPSFAVREIGFFDQDGDLIAIWAGADVEPRQTGVIVYLVEHALSFSRVADGLIIVDAPPETELTPGQMLVAKSGLSFPGFLECDGSVYPQGTYPTLEAAGYIADQLPSVVDLGGDGQLIFGVSADVGAGDQNFYFWDRDGSGHAYTGDPIDHNALDTLFNGGANTTDAIGTRSATIDGVDVRLPTKDEMRNLGLTYGRPGGWPTSVWSSTPGSSAGYHKRVVLSNNTFGDYADTSPAYVALEVIGVQMQTVVQLPDSTSLNLPSGYSYYIKL